MPDGSNDESKPNLLEQFSKSVQPAKLTTNPDPRNYGLIVTIPLGRHMREEVAKTFIKILNQATGAHFELRDPEQTSQRAEATLPGTG